MVKLVRGQDNVISLHITSTYPVGEVSGTFVAKSVTIPVPQSRNGTEIEVTAADVEAIGEDFMIGVMTLKNEANEEVAVVRVPLAVLPEGSDNRGFTDVRITLVSIREVEGGDHGGSGVKMFPTKDDFPVPGDIRYIYLAEDTGKMYRWDVAAEDYVEVSGVVHANLAETDPEKHGYVLNRQTRFLYNNGWDGTHPYVSVANFVPDYDSGKTYSRDEVVFHSWKVEEPDVYDNGIFKCLADGTTVAPPDSSRWVEVDLRNFFQKEIIVSDDGETPTGDEEIWIDETETPEGQSYNDLVDKPQINGHELTGNKTSRQLGIVDTADLEWKGCLQGTFETWDDVPTVGTSVSFRHQPVQSGDYIRLIDGSDYSDGLTDSFDAQTESDSLLGRKTANPIAYVENGISFTIPEGFTLSALQLTALKNAGVGLVSVLSTPYRGALVLIYDAGRGSYSKSNWMVFSENTDIYEKLDDIEPMVDRKIEESVGKINLVLDDLNGETF